MAPVKRQVARLIGSAALAAALLTAPAAAAPRVDAGDAARTDAALRTLREAVGRLKTGPTRAALDRAKGAMKTLEESVDRYFHAANLREPAARPHVLALRHQIHLALGAEDAVLTIHDDVVRFRPEIHRALADASRAVGDRAAEIRHLREAIALAGPDADHLAALRAAYLAMGRDADAEAVARRLAHLAAREGG